jgi:pyruvate ferredoxin oxidoreductase gamma subunit
MFRIRFHGRGGQGVKTASRILGSAFFREGYEVQDAPRYGAERRGAPIFAYVRAAREPIKERGNIVEPDLVAVADDTLVPMPAAGVLAELSARSVLLVRSVEPAEEWKARLKLAGPVLVLPAAADADEGAEAPYAGARCAGAAARLTGAIRRESLAAAIAEEVAAFGADAVAKNRAAALAAFDAMAGHAAAVRESAERAAGDYGRPGWIALPFEAAAVSAPDIFAAATSVQVRTGLWRTMRPVIDDSRCKRCVWVCATLCPDSAIRADAEGRPEIDYDHCKGCLVCAAVCPPHAIAAVPEQRAQREKAAA